MPQKHQELMPVRVIHQMKLTENVYLLKLEKKIDFVAGQVVGLTLNDSIPPRLYSICCGEKEKTIDILYDIHEDGILTPRLRGLKDGDTVLLTAPSGDFRSDTEKGWYIATGTGIAPFYSMVQSGLGINKKLICGGRTEESFYFNEYFSGFFGKDYIKCCTNCIDHTFYHGRITKFISELINLPDDQKYYLCGSAEMVVDLRDLLIQKGIRFENIISEIYF